MVTSEPEILNRAAVTLQESVYLTLDDDPDRPKRLNDLGNALQTRFKRAGELEDLEQAITSLRRAVELTSDEHPDMPMYLNNLGNALQSHFMRTGKIDDLEQAIARKHHAVDLTPDGHINKPAFLNNLGNALEVRFDRLGQLTDLGQAIEIKSRAVELMPDEDPDKPGRLSNLANAIHARFNRLGALGDLEEAVTIQCHAVDLIRDGHPDESSLLNNLGHVLLTRFERVGQFIDLEQAVESMRRASDLTPAEHPNKAAFLNNLGNALGIRFDRLGHPDDLEQAIAIKRQAVELTPDDHSNKAAFLNNLGNALGIRFDRLGHPDDLEQAIAIKRQAVELTPDGHPDKPARLNSLGRAFQTRFERLSDLEDLKQAVAVQRSAVGLTQEGHPARLGRLIALGKALHTRFKRVGELDDLEDAFRSFMLAADQESGPPSKRLEAVKLCADVSKLRVQLGCTTTYQELLSVYSRAFALIPQVAWLGNSITQRRAALPLIGEVVNSAVSVAIQTGDFSRAIEWLEEGRGVIWGQLVRLRSPVDDLRAHHPDLADTVQFLSRSLESLGEDKSNSKTTAHARDRTSTRIKLAQQYNHLLVLIRRLNGFENFLAPKTFVNLVPPRLEDGPIIIIHAYASSCDALVVFGSTQPIVHIPLPEMSHALAEQMHSDFTQSLLQADGHIGELADTDATLSSAAQDHIDLLGAQISIPLRTSTISPIVKVLENLNTADALPHITWCPTGLLAFLPIHAAGIYSEHGTKLSDLAVSSYTPTLSAFPQQHYTPAGGWSSMNALVISHRRDPGLAELPGVITEVDNIRKHIDGQIIHLDDEHATIGAALSAINDDRCQIVHFACRGRQPSETPVESAFILHDGDLTLSRLMSSSVSNAELAFLSADNTAIGDEALPEEAMHLAGGMLVAGFKSVIGTIWSINGQDAALVTDEVYRHLKGGYVQNGTLRPAYALHEAVKVLKEKVGESNFDRWVPYVHFGM
ncbi:CHAT domain-containing protein [Vararia minispora EC-137]|uniref:CHAT domain-containing protein n=1 Tax=Vararia minispora EC-137 TaxID=1314806 RepID=A0ACB8QA53_9AGAM|nr:CHAT domain-containing protein [Vararia minispora EC-137]